MKFFMFCTAPHQTGRVHLCVYKNPVVIWFSHFELYSVWKQDMVCMAVKSSLLIDFYSPPLSKRRHSCQNLSNSLIGQSYALLRFVNEQKPEQGESELFLIWATTKVVLLRTVGQSVANWCHGRPHRMCLDQINKSNAISHLIWFKILPLLSLFLSLSLYLCVSVPPLSLFSFPL